MSLTTSQKGPLPPQVVVEQPNEPMATEGIPEFCEEYVRAAARRSFPFFRRYVRPNMLWGWWVEEVADELQRFHRDWIDGLCPKLALEAPPQHGKSWRILLPGWRASIRTRRRSSRPIRTSSATAPISAYKGS